MTVMEWMEEEYAIEKGKQQGHSIVKYLGAETQRVSTEASDSDSYVVVAKNQEAT